MDDEDAGNKNATAGPVEPTIEEDKLAEAEGGPALPSPRGPQSTPRHVRGSSYQRLSRLSDDARLSIQSIVSTPEKKETASNRSSATIRYIQVNGSGGLNDVDFEKALTKFAAERDSFVSDLTISAGAIIPNRPRPRPKTQRIHAEDGAVAKSGAGSIRRKISFRDIGNIKRQPSLARQREWSHTLPYPEKQLPLYFAMGYFLIFNLYRIRADLSAPEQLQLCHSEPTTTEY